MPDDSFSAAAEKGTLLHDLDDRGEESEQVSEQEILERNRSIRETFLKSTMAQLGIPEDAKCKEIRKTRYSLRDENGDELVGVDGMPFTGEPDVIYYFPSVRTVFVCDSKFGRVIVPAAEVNWQLAVYACMVGDPEYGDFECDNVVVAITQPLAKPNFTAAAYDRQTLATEKAEILRHWRAIKAPNQPRNPSVDACRYCRARASCPDALEVAKQVATIKISELPIPELEALAPKMELAGSIIEAYWTRLKYVAEKHPQLLDKFTLKEGAEMRSVAPEDSGEAYSRLTNAGLCDASEYASACKLSITKIEDVVAKRQKIKKADAKKKLEDALGDVLKKKRKSPSLEEKKPQPLLKQ